MRANNEFGAWVYLFWVMVFIPAMGLWSWYRVRSGKALPAKESRYASMIVFQIWTLVLTLITMHDTRTELFSAGWPPLWGWCAAAAYMVLITYRLTVGWRKIPDERKQRARRLLPETPAHLRYWIPISVLAGVSEELAFRGLAFVLLTRWTHSQLVAASISVAAFAIAHMVQGWRGVLGTGLIAALMHMLVYATGGLYLPVAFHACYDLVVGFVAVRAFMRTTSPSLVQSQAAGSQP